MKGSFEIDGTVSRKRKTPCKHCGAMKECDLCWDHVRDWSPFGIWHCLLCRMPQAIYHINGAGLDPVRCEFCGWDATRDKAFERALAEFEARDGTGYMETDLTQLAAE